MKKLLCALLTAVLLLPAIALADGVVNVYNWYDYIDKSVLKLFEEETGITVNYMNFTTNEDMIIQVNNTPGAFDVVFPSEYMVERMNKADMLMELDYSRLPNFSYIKENLLNPSYDPNNAHSVPYMWGTLGILYNTDIVDEADMNSWSALWNPKYPNQVLMMDSLRDAMAVALKYLGYSVNSTDLNEIKAASDLLIAQKSSGAIKSYGLDEFKDKMVAGEAGMALVYSGDAAYSLELAEDEHVNLAYIVPQEGSNVWTDTMVIPADAKNVDNAYLFIDFLCRPDIAQMNCEAIGYSSPNTGAIELMGDDYISDPLLNPDDATLALCEYYNDLDEDTLLYYNTFYSMVKNAK